MKEMWNERYSGVQYIYGIKPNTFFKDWIETQIPGDILFPAEGEGRNAVHASIQGWNVNAFDYSIEGKNKAHSLAEKFNTKIVYDVSSAETYQANRKFEAIVLIFAHFPPNIRSQIHQNMIKLLKPGGHIILEAYSKDQLKFATGGPKNESLLYSIQELENDFQALEIIKLQKLVRYLDEGPLHRGDSDVLQLIARKN